MYLKKLSIIGFKNIQQSTLEFSSRINCFVGDNGAGKTNLIDAIHYLSMCKSVLSMTDGQCVGHGGDFFLLEGQYLHSGDRRESVVCSFKRGLGKSIKRNTKEYERLSDHVGLIPIVVVSPADSLLISDAAAERRRYLNASLSQLDKGYLNAIMRYNQTLNERNRLLKGDSSGSFPRSDFGDVMEILNEQLISSGEIVHRGRMELIEQLSPLVSEYYRELSDDREQVELSYNSELNDLSFAELLLRNSERDRINQFTTGGIHRDDLRMRIAGHPLRKYGSQGQQKSFLLALKLAQYSLVERERGDKPILLLDDLFDKLDPMRVERLLGLVSSDKFGQIFITDCNRSGLESSLKGSNERYSIFTVAGGDVVEEGINNEPQTAK